MKLIVMVMWNYEFADKYLTHHCCNIVYPLSLILIIYMLLFIAVLEIRAQQVQLVPIANHGCLSTLYQTLRIRPIVVWMAAILISHQMHSRQWMVIHFMIQKEQHLLVLAVIVSRHIRTFSWLCRQLRRVLINSWHWVTSMHILANIFLSTVHQTKAGRLLSPVFYWLFFKYSSLQSTTNCFEQHIALCIFVTIVFWWW